MKRTYTIREFKNVNGITKFEVNYDGENKPFGQFMNRDRAVTMADRHA